MYTVIKRMEISAAHSLSLSYPSKCEYLHGHNWIITVHCRSKELNTDGMVIDFTHIRLHPEKRTKTAGVPVWKPSPWRL